MRERLIKSRWVYVYPRGSTIALFNAWTLEIFFGDKETSDLFSFLKEPHSMDEVFVFLKKKDRETRKKLETLKQEGFIVSEHTEELQHIENWKNKQIKISKKELGRGLKLNSLRVILTEKCNFSCKYCFVKTRKKGNLKTISWDNLKRGVDLLLELSDSIEVQFFGGEPLIEFGLIKKSVNYINQRAPEVYYGITTNATLMDEEKANFMKENNFLVSVSLDGWEALHNENRTYLDGRGTFQNTIEGIKILQDKGNEIGILITPAENNVNQLAEACEYIINNLGCKFITINTPQPYKGNWPVDGRLFSQEIKKCFEVAKKHKATINSFGTRVLYSINDKKPMILSCSKFGNNFTATLTPEGGISPCIVSWDCKEYISSLENFSYIGKFSDWKIDSPYFFKKCTDCPAMNVCGGPCPLEVYEMKKFLEPIDHQRCRFFEDFLEWSIWYEE